MNTIFNTGLTVSNGYLSTGDYVSIVSILPVLNVFEKENRNPDLLSKFNELNHASGTEETCNICLEDKMISVVLKPCNHKQICNACLESFLEQCDAKCPLCRTDITDLN